MCFNGWSIFLNLKSSPLSGSLLYHRKTHSDEQGNFNSTIFVKSFFIVNFKSPFCVCQQNNTVFGALFSNHASFKQTQRGPGKRLTLDGNSQLFLVLVSYFSAIGEKKSHLFSLLIQEFYEMFIPPFIG